MHFKERQRKKMYQPGRKEAEDTTFLTIKMNTEL